MKLYTAQNRLVFDTALNDRKFCVAKSIAIYIIQSKIVATARAWINKSSLRSRSIVIHSRKTISHQAIDSILNINIRGSNQLSISFLILGNLLNNIYNQSRETHSSYRLVLSAADSTLGYTLNRHISALTCPWCAQLEASCLHHIFIVLDDL